MELKDLVNKVNTLAALKQTLGLNAKADLVGGKVPTAQLPPADEQLGIGETQTTAFRGDYGKIAYDHSQATHDKSMVGLPNVDNTSDAAKPVSTAQSAALALKQDKSTLSNVDNTSDADKPVSTAQSAALALKQDKSTLGNDVISALSTKVIRSTVINLVQVGNEISWDAANGTLYRITLSGDATLQNPTNIVPGAIYQLEINQDDSGLRILSWGTNYQFPNGDKPIISLDANAYDIITIYSKSATELAVTYVQNFK